MGKSVRQQAYEAGVQYGKDNFLSKGAMIAEFPTLAFWIFMMIVLFKTNSDVKWHSTLLVACWIYLLYLNPLTMGRNTISNIYIINSILYFDYGNRSMCLEYTISDNGKFSSDNAYAISTVAKDKEYSQVRKFRIFNGLYWKIREMGWIDKSGFIVPGYLLSHDEYEQMYNAYNEAYNSDKNITSGPIKVNGIEVKDDEEVIYQRSTGRTIKRKKTNSAAILVIILGCVFILMGAISPFMYFDWDNSEYDEQFDWIYVKANLDYIDKRQNVRLSSTGDSTYEDMFIGHYIAVVDGITVQLTDEEKSESKLKATREFYVNPDDYSEYHTPIEENDRFRAFGYLIFLPLGIPIVIFGVKLLKYV